MPDIAFLLKGSISEKKNDKMLLNFVMFHYVTELYYPGCSLPYLLW
jgi:hypothetical protein